MRSLESFRSPCLLRSLLQSASRSGHESPFLWMSQIEMAGRAPFGRLVSNTAIVARSVRYQTDWNSGSPVDDSDLDIVSDEGTVDGSSGVFDRYEAGLSCPVEGCERLYRISRVVVRDRDVVYLPEVSVTGNARFYVDDRILSPDWSSILVVEEVDRINGGVGASNQPVPCYLSREGCSGLVPGEARDEWGAGDKAVLRVIDSTAVVVVIGGKGVVVETGGN